jgi:hypothetical protein
MPTKKDAPSSPQDKKSMGDLDTAVVIKGTTITVQELQNIYYELTGKTETISRSYNDSVKLTFADIEQLHHRITQACEQYHIRADNMNVKINYINDTCETLSSFDRFRTFNSGSSSIVESIVMEYNFLIVLPHVNTTQSYTLSLRLMSRIAIGQKAMNEVPTTLQQFVRIISGPTIHATIKYIDYVVATTLLHVIDGWANSVPKSRTSKTWQQLQRNSHLVPIVSRSIVGLLVAGFILFALPNLLSATSSLLDFGRVMLCTFVGLFAAYMVSHYLGRAAERSLDRWSELSYVQLTAGDKQAITDAEHTNKSEINMAWIKFTLSQSISLVAKIVIYFLAK